MRLRQSIQTRLALRLDARLGRRGRVLAGRHHDVHVTTPRQTHSALLDVLHNARRHGEPLAPRWGGVDPSSSAWYFDRWSTDDWRARLEPPRGAPPVAPPASWLVRTGSRQHGLLAPTEPPPVARAS